MITMREELSGRPCDITKEGDKIKIVFHPMLSSAKDPEAKLFTLKLSNADIAKLKKAI
jgi:hypothetical protein|tara:strand:- start:5 stop:178 length:174 start_codon:yes stop_codon:yes gene_type:complete